MPVTTLITLHSPFNLQDKTIERVEIGEKVSLQTFLENNVKVPAEMEYHASVNGRVYDPIEIPMYMVTPGDCVVVCPVLKGGGGGKNPLAILAGLALSIFAFGVVSPFVSGLFGGSAIAGSLAAGLTLMVGGQLISNAFSPSLQQPNDSGDNVTSPSYGWGALQSITQQGAVIPMTYGTIRTAGQVLNQHVSVDETDNTQYLEMLMCGGEGPIDSFTDVRINDNPIENYVNAQYFTRPGTNSQTSISGFEKLYDAQAVNVTLDSDDSGGAGEWFTIEMTGDTADSLEMVVDFPRGLCYYSGEKVEPDEVTVQVQFQYAIELSGGSWGPWKSAPTLEVTAASSSPLTRIVRTGGITSGRYRVRGQVASKSHVGNKAITATTWSSLTAVIDSPMIHPNKALVGVRVQATDQLNGGAPTITWRQTRSHVLVWDGVSWTEKNAQNPAWIIYDLCVQARRLDGTVYVFGDNPSRIDYPAFAAWASWNDRTLGNRPALRMNLLVDESKSLWQWVNDIAASARGAVVMKGTKISCIWDQPSNPVQLFSMGNIIAGSFSGEFLPLESRANAVEIAFNNEDKNFEREQITVYADNFNDSDSRSNPVSVELTGITDYERAYREGMYRLRQNKYILRTITFSAEVDAIACQVGDVINVQHDVPQWGRGGRILAVSGNQLTLDIEYTFTIGKTYSIMVRTQNDTIIERSVSGTGTTNTVSVSGASGISPYDVFSIGEVNQVAKAFRVQTMSRNADSQVTLTCSEYNPSIYTEDVDIPAIDTDGAVNEIAGLELLPSGYYTHSGQWIAELWATWAYRGRKPASYQVEWKYGCGLWGGRINTMETTAQCPTRSGTSLYSVRVRALYPSGSPSEWSYATADSSMLGDGIPPAAPKNLTAEGWFGFAELNWENPPDIDLAYIEVWENTEDNLQTATMIGTTRGSSYTRLLGAGGVTWYWVRAVNYTRQKSPFNSEAGTPCIIAPESHEAYVEALLKANPWLQGVINDLTEQIEELDPVDVQDRLDAIDEIIPELDGRIKDNQDAIQNNIFPAIDAVASGVLRLDDEADRTRNVFRWAGIEVNEKEGTVVIRGLEDLRTETGYQFSEVEERLDAQTASISLKASRTYVDEMAASLISSVITAEEWKFEGTLDGWTGQNATLTATPGGITYEITGADPSMTSPDISIDGSVNNIIGLQLRQTAGNANANIRIQYKTTDHEYSDSYMKRVLVIGDLTLTRSVQVNMYALDAGGDDWENSTITGIRILIGENVGAEYLVSLVNIGQSSINELALSDIEMRITQAEIDIDGANAAIQLKADQTTVSALSTELRAAEVDIDAMNARVELKADKTTVNDMETRLEYAEIKADAALGYVSMAVSDSILPQEQIDNIAEAAIRNSVTESQDAQRRHVAVALAKQELKADVEDAKRAAAQYRLELIAVIDTNKALAEQEINAVATDLSAEVTARQTLATVVDSNTAAIQTEQQARVDAISAEALAREQLAAVVGDNTAAIQTEAYTRANQIQAEAQARQTLAVTVGNNTAAIQQTSQVVANVNGQLSAKWTVQTDVNGNVAGIQLFNGGASKTAFVVAADHFMVTPPGRNNPTRVLDYNSSTGSLYIKNLFVDGAWIQNATIGRLKLGYGQITSPNIAYSNQFTINGYGSRYTSPSVYVPLVGDRSCPVMVECSFLYRAWGDANVDAAIYAGGNTIYTEVFQPRVYGNYYMMRTRLETTLSGTQRFYFELTPRSSGQLNFSRPCISATVYYR